MKFFRWLKSLFCDDLWVNIGQCPQCGRNTLEEYLHMIGDLEYRCKVCGYSKIVE